MSIQLNAASSAYGKANTLDRSSSSQDNSFKMSVGGFNHALQNANAAYSGKIVANDHNVPLAQKNSLSSFVSQITGQSFNAIKASENISAKALVNQASSADVVTAISEAEIALQSIVAVRDKVIGAYMDIIKMQI